MAKCEKCGKSAGMLMNICDDCTRKAQEEAAASYREKTEREATEAKATAERVAAITVTTTMEVPGRAVESMVDVIAAECVYGIDVFGEIATALSDFFGGRSEVTQKRLRDARNVCLLELRKECDLVGGDAVIGVDLAYSEFSGGGRSMLFLVASGRPSR